VYSFLFVLIIALYVLSVNWLLFGECVLGMKVRLACCSLIYKKSLNLDKNNYCNDVTLGQTINLLSNDVRRFDNGFILIPYLLWITPAQLVITLCMLVLRSYYFPLVGVGLLIACTVLIGTYSNTDLFLTETSSF
jgi:ATP-binding cassette subfamily C (CFTR/MRP) protein 4